MMRPGIELIEGARANVIRYYFDVQRPQAEEIRALVQSILQDLQWGGDFAHAHFLAGWALPNTGVTA